MALFSRPAKRAPITNCVGLAGRFWRRNGGKKWEMVTETYRDDLCHSVTFIEEILEGVIAFLAGLLAFFGNLVESYVEAIAGFGSSEHGRGGEPGIHDCLRIWCQYQNDEYLRESTLGRGRVNWAGTADVSLPLEWPIS